MQTLLHALVWRTREIWREGCKTELVKRLAIKMYPIIGTVKLNFRVCFSFFFATDINSRAYYIYVFRIWIFNLKMVRIPSPDGRIFSLSTSLSSSFQGAPKTIFPFSGNWVPHSRKPGPPFGKPDDSFFGYLTDWDQEWKFFQHDKSYAIT